MPSIEPGALLTKLVDTHWETAARHAWKKYNRRGRGAIVFPIQPSAEKSERTPLKYLTFSDPAAARSGAFSKLFQLVRSYDPDRQIVAAAVLPDERTVFEVYGQEPAPPEA